METQPKTGKGKVFKHPFLELLHKSSPLSTLLTYGGTLALAFYLNHRFGPVHQFTTGIGIYLAGVFVWTFFEYVLHRYVFHFISDTPAGRTFHRIVHGYHHEYPRDEEHLFMPPVPGLVLASLFLGLFYLLMGGYSFVFFGGFITGYMAYSALHYSIHRFKPPQRLKWLWQHHALHHYKFPDKAYGVSSPFWDRIFGTMPQRAGRRKEAVDLERVNESRSLISNP